VGNVLCRVKVTLGRGPAVHDRGGAGEAWPGEVGHVLRLCMCVGGPGAAEGTGSSFKAGRVSRWRRYTHMRSNRELVAAAGERNYQVV